jgi:NAD(P)-dependent dehydrogenase (short-subunit alcohol dehydrogenase family)
MTWVTGKRVVVTGATSGLGRRIADRLAVLGAEVVLACRDVDRGQQVARDIGAMVGAGRASVLHLDTSDQASIRAFGRAFRGTYASLDVLVNNAGTLVSDRQTSVDGIELTFATNVLGYHLVTAELAGVLRAGAPSRIVNMASTYASDVDLDDLQFVRRPYDGMTAYAQSKACDRMLTWALARRFEATTVTVNAVAPGLVVGTHLYRDLDATTLRYLEQAPGRSVAEGAETAVWLAASDDVTGVTGRFFEQEAELVCQFRDEAAEERLWRACQELTGQLEATTS